MGKRVFVVDDLPIMRDLLSGIFESLGYEISGSAENGRDAIVGYSTHKPDLMTLDVSLPDMDGISVLKQIREQHPQAQVLIVTANDQKLLEDQAFALGACGVLLKPFVIEDIVKILSRLWPA